MNNLSLTESNSVMNAEKSHVAAVQFQPERMEIENNIRRLEGLIGDRSWDLLVLPELCSTGYFFTDRDELMPLAERPDSGRFCGWMRSLAEERSMVVVGGFAERDASDRLFNAALIARPDGSASVYRKVHLFYKEKLVFEPGDGGFHVIDVGGVRLGTMICYDWRFPEATRALTLGGADIIAHPSNLVAARSLWGPTMQTRAFENKVVCITANRTGSETLGDETLEFTGGSQIVGYNGSTIAEADAGESTIIDCDVSPMATRGKSINPFNDILTDRRPELYAAVCRV